MSRYTEKMLKGDIADINRDLAATGSAYYLEVSPRNGYCAVDLCATYQDGRTGVVHLFASGSPRECGQAVLRSYGDYARCIPFNTRYTLSMAKAVIGRYVDLSGKPFTVLKGRDVELLNVWATKCRARLGGEFLTPSKRAIAFAEKLESWKS